MWTSTAQCNVHIYDSMTVITASTVARVEPRTGLAPLPSPPSSSCSGVVEEEVEGVQSSWLQPTENG